MRELLKDNPRLWMEFVITVVVIVGSFVVLALPTPDIVNQGAYQLLTLSLGWWFGRSASLLRRDNGNGNGH